MLLGFSTGCLYKTKSVDETLKLYRDLDIKGTELHFAEWSEAGGEDLVRLAEELHGFDYVSFHAPKFPYQKDDASRAVIKVIQRVNEIRPLDRVIVHPDPVKDFAVWAEAGLPVGIENMDHRKPSGRTVEDIKKILDEYPSFGLVLDVNHIYTNDPTMRLADEFFRVLGHRLVQYHVSGFRDLHESLYDTQQPQIVRAMQDLSKPIIVESEMPEDGVLKERAFILANLPHA
jgi:hypothetical protein